MQRYTDQKIKLSASQSCRERSILIGRQHRWKARSFGNFAEVFGFDNCCDKVCDFGSLISNNVLIDFIINFLCNFDDYDVLDCDFYDTSYND